MWSYSHHDKNDGARKEPGMESTKSPLIEELQSKVAALTIDRDNAITIVKSVVARAEGCLMR